MTDKLQSLKGSRFVTLYAALSEIFGDLNAAVVFCSLGQWDGYGKEPDGTIYKSHRQAAKESGMTIDSFKTARQRLVKLGAITCSYTNQVPRTTKYKIHWEVVNQMLEKHLSSEENYAEVVGRKATDKQTEKPHAIQYIQQRQQLKQQQKITSIDSKELNDLISLFRKSINPTLDYGNKTQRSAANTIIQTLGGIEPALEAVAYAISIQGNKYAPVITTPLELKNKLGQLYAYKKRDETSSNNLIASI